MGLFIYTYVCSKSGIKENSCYRDHVFENFLADVVLNVVKEKVKAKTACHKFGKEYSRHPLV